MSKKEKIILFPCLILITVTIVLAACLGMFGGKDEDDVESVRDEYEAHFPETDEEYKAVVIAEDLVKKEFADCSVKFKFPTIRKINEKTYLIVEEFNVNGRTDYYFSVWVTTDGDATIYKIFEK